MTDQVQSTTDQGPGTQRGAAPWTNDIAALTDDPALQARFDEYLRTNIQPRMTQLEQQAARYNPDADNLWQAFANDADGTFTEITRTLYGDEQAELVQRALAGELGAQAQQQAETQVQQAAAEAQQQAETQVPQNFNLPPEYKEALDEFVSERQAKQYTDALSQLASQPQNADLIVTVPDFDAEGNQVGSHQVDLIAEHVHPFVYAAEGDLEEGIARLRNFVKQFGVPASQAQIDEAGAQHAAPNVMGGEGAQAATTPVNEKLSWDQAWDSFKNDIHDANHPKAPPVGIA